MTTYLSATSKSKISGPAPSKTLRLFALYENLTRFVLPLCSAVPGRPNPETPVDQANNIVDISKVGLKQFWNLRNHMQDASTLATAHYPETLDRIFVRAPKMDEMTSLMIEFADHRGAFFLPDGVGVDQEMVRPDHDVQNLHPWRQRRESDAVGLHRRGEHPQEIRRRA